MIILFILSFAGIFMFDFIPLMKKKDTATLIAFLVFYFLALFWAACMLFNIPLPSVQLFIEKLYAAMGFMYPVG